MTTESVDDDCVLSVQDVLEVLLSAKDKAKFIGLALKLPFDEVNSICSNEKDPQERLTAVIGLYLRQVRPSWKSIVDALRNPTVYEPRLAKQVEATKLTVKKCSESKPEFDITKSGSQALGVIEMPRITRRVESLKVANPQPKSDTNSDSRVITLIDSSHVVESKLAAERVSQSKPITSIDFPAGHLVSTSSDPGSSEASLVYDNSGQCATKVVSDNTCNSTNRNLAHQSGDLGSNTDSIGNNSCGNVVQSINAHRYELTVLMCGDSGVGKTSLMHHYMGESLQNIFSTISNDIMVKTVKLMDNRIEVKILDMPGDKTLQDLPKYADNYEKADWVILVYDVTSMNSFKSLDDRWINTIREHNLDLILVANKVDLKIEVSWELVNDWREDKHIRRFYKTSAVRGDEVNNLFECIAGRFTENQKSVLESEPKPKVVPAREEPVTPKPEVVPSATEEPVTPKPEVVPATEEPVSPKPEVVPTTEKAQKCCVLM